MRGKEEKTRKRIENKILHKEEEKETERKRKDT